MIHVFVLKFKLCCSLSWLQLLIILFLLFSTSRWQHTKMPDNDSNTVKNVKKKKKKQKKKKSSPGGG